MIVDGVIWDIIDEAAGASIAPKPKEEDDRLRPRGKWEDSLGSGRRCIATVHAKAV